MNVMSLRRSSFQISIELLTAISHGEYRPTRLMYECNMSWKSLRDTLALLESKGLVDNLSTDKKHKHYCVTATGREIIGYYSGLEELVQVS
jgi:predicted transcriptional regulator